MNHGRKSTVCWTAEFLQLFEETTSSLNPNPRTEVGVTHLHVHLWMLTTLNLGLDLEVSSGRDDEHRHTKHKSINGDGQNIGICSLNKKELTPLVNQLHLFY